MTKPLPFTQAGLRRAIVAAQKAGLYVTGISPDGTVLTAQNPPVIVPVEPGDKDETATKWSDVRA